MTDDRAFGADDVAGALYVGERLRKLRFLMTDNILVERLYRNRYLHRGTHPILSAMQLRDTLWLNLRAAGSDTS